MFILCHFKGGSLQFIFGAKLHCFCCHGLSLGKFFIVMFVLENFVYWNMIWDTHTCSIIIIITVPYIYIHQEGLIVPLNPLCLSQSPSNDSAPPSPLIMNVLFLFSPYPRSSFFSLRKIIDGSTWISIHLIKIVHSDLSLP